MATHSSVLAWRIPGTGEPGGLLSMGSHSQTRLKRLSSSSSTGKKYRVGKSMWCYKWHFFNLTWLSFSFCGPCFLHSRYIIHLSKTPKGERDSNILHVLDFHPRFLEALGSHKGAQRLLLWEEGVSRRWAGSHLGHAEQVGTTVGYTSYRHSREPCNPLISCKKFTEPGGFARALSNKGFQVAQWERICLPM